MPRTRDALDDCTQLNVWVQVWYGNPSGATWKNFMQQSSFVSPHSQPFRGIPPTFGLVLSRRCRSTTTTFLISVQSLFSLAPYDSLKTENRCHSNTKARHYLQVWVCWHGLEFKRPQCNGKELITFFFFYVKIKQGTTYVCILFSLHTGVGQAHVYSANGHCAAFLANIDNRRKVTVRFQGQSYLLPPWSVSILPDCKKVIFNTAQVTRLSLPVLQLLNSSWYQEGEKKTPINFFV